MLLFGIIVKHYRCTSFATSAAASAIADMPWNLPVHDGLFQRHIGPARAS
jgi:hypothetical protein